MTENPRKWPRSISTLITGAAVSCSMAFLFTPSVVAAQSKARAASPTSGSRARLPLDLRQVRLLTRPKAPRHEGRSGRAWRFAKHEHVVWTGSHLHRRFWQSLLVIVDAPPYDQPLVGIAAPLSAPSKVIDVSAEIRRSDSAVGPDPAEREGISAVRGQQPRAIERLGWLHGCWEAIAGERTIDEQWMPQRGGSLIGMSRTVSGNRLVEYELVVIREQNQGLAYEAQPSGQPKAVFLSTAITDSSVVFENSQHDFPQKIGYARVSPDSLLAYIEGPGRDGPRRISFPYRRVACAGG